MGDKDETIQLLVDFIYSTDLIMDPDVEFAMYTVEEDALGKHN